MLSVVPCQAITPPCWWLRICIANIAECQWQSASTERLWWRQRVLVSLSLLRTICHSQLRVNTKRTAGLLTFQYWHSNTVSNSNKTANRCESRSIELFHQNQKIQKVKLQRFELVFSSFCFACFKKTLSINNIIFQLNSKRSLLWISMEQDGMGFIWICLFWQIGSVLHNRFHCWFPPTFFSLNKWVTAEMEARASCLSFLSARYCMAEENSHLC